MSCFASAGFFCPSTTSLPLTCEKGFYCPTNGLSAATACPAGSFCNATGLSAAFACPAGSYSVFTNATSSATCLRCPVSADDCPRNGLPTCGSSTDCTPSVLLRGGIAIDTSQWRSTSWPTVGANGEYGFNRNLQQFLDAKARTFLCEIQGFSITAVFKFTGAVGLYESLFNGGYGYGLNLARSNSNNFLTLYTTSAKGTELVFDSKFPSATILQDIVYVATVIYSPHDSSTSLYVNGSLISTINSLPLLHNRFLDNVYIGKSFYTWDSYFNGFVFYLGAYDRTLSTTDIFRQHKCASTCALCPVKFYCPQNETSISYTCMAGYFCVVDNSTVAAPIICPVGAYCDRPGLILPLSCPSGSFSNSTGATSCICKCQKTNWK